MVGWALLSSSPLLTTGFGIIFYSKISLHRERNFCLLLYIAYDIWKCVKNFSLLSVEGWEYTNWPSCLYFSGEIKFRNENMSDENKEGYVSRYLTDMKEDNTTKHSSFNGSYSFIYKPESKTIEKVKLTYTDKEAEENYTIACYQTVRLFYFYSNRYFNSKTTVHSFNTDIILKPSVLWVFQSDSTWLKCFVVN